MPWTSGWVGWGAGEGDAPGEGSGEVAGDRAGGQDTWHVTERCPQAGSTCFQCLASPGMRPRSPAQHIRCLRRQPGGSQAQRAEAAVPGLTRSEWVPCFWFLILSHIIAGWRGESSFSVELTQTNDTVSVFVFCFRFHVWEALRLCC